MAHYKGMARGAWMAWMGLAARTALAAMVALAPRDAHAGKHVSLFNGATLAGWHTQGDCKWSAVAGDLRGVNPNGNWCHLVSDSSYTDFSLTVEYKIVKGNTGVYVRAGRENTDCCGLQGTQVDIGPSQDGSVMWVRDGKWQWYELITKAVTEKWVDYKQWNSVTVDVQGTGIKTFVNGHAIFATAKADTMFASGKLALQLHSGGKGDTILFRNLDLYSPKRIPGCLDSTMVEYDPNANFAAPENCKTKRTVGLSRAPAEKAGSLVRDIGRQAKGYDSRGRRIRTLGAGDVIWKSP